MIEPNSQPLPAPGHEIVCPLVIETIQDLCESWKIKDDASQLLIETLHKRFAYGLQKYGTPAMTFNGRDALQDAIEEACDLIVYLGQYTMENKQSMYSGTNFKGAIILAHCLIEQKLLDHSLAK